PIANFSVQAGTLNIIDLSYDPDFQYKRPDKGVIEWYWKWKRTADSTWTVGAPSGIAAPGSYDIHLRVKDCYNVWSEPVQKTINVVDPNRPPVASFTWTPTLIYEGDTVNLINQSFDPDTDPITYQWSVFNPAGSTTGYTTKNISLNNVLPGTYWITLRVWDNHNNSGVTTKSFAVNVLNITGYVKHTPEWNTNRITYNRSKTGLDDSPRGYSVFWAGELFMLEAATTDTGSSAAKAQHLTVEMLGSGYNASLSGNAGKTYWTGNMWRDSFENISDGTYTFRFKVTYSNGVVKTDDVSIIISGSWQDYFKFHRSW
ncbi:MAG: PKD domain-containing protein, partial [Eubacteriales bacterium]